MVSQKMKAIVMISTIPFIPGATETPDNGVDEDCDGEDELSTQPDVDDDGDGFTENDGDCNDVDPSIFPNATETAWMVLIQIVMEQTP